MDKFPYSSAPLRRVKGIQFGILDPEFLVGLHGIHAMLLPQYGCAVSGNRFHTFLPQHSFYNVARAQISYKCVFHLLSIAWHAIFWFCMQVAKPVPVSCKNVAEDYFPLLQRRYSVAKIDVGQTYENGRPKLNGLSDPRLGTMDRAVKCTTDGANQQDSPGYFGHIELAKPVFHIGFITTVVKVLRCVSYHSSKLLVDKVRATIVMECLLTAQLCSFHFLCLQSLGW